MRRPPMHPTWRDALAILWIAALLLAMSAVSPTPPGQTAEERGRGKARDVPMAQLKAKIAAEKLSDHPARWATRPGESGLGESGLGESGLGESGLGESDLGDSDLEEPRELNPAFRPAPRASPGPARTVSPNRPGP